MERVRHSHHMEELSATAEHRGQLTLPQPDVQPTPGVSLQVSFQRLRME